MTWSEAIIEQFGLANRFTHDETEFYGPYNTLLHELFPPSLHYQVVPQYKGPITPGAVDFTTIFIVKRRRVPVMFIEIKTFPSLNNKFDRQLADKEMRERFDALIDSLAIPSLYGISAMGTRFAIYKYDKETKRLTPRAIPRDPEIVNDVAPADRWNYELMEPTGEAAIKVVVEDVRSMCSALAD